MYSTDRPISHAILHTRKNYPQNDPDEPFHYRGQVTPWRNGSASDSRSEGCVFESRRGQVMFYPRIAWLSRLVHVSESLSIAGSRGGSCNPSYWEANK